MGEKTKSLRQRDEEMQKIKLARSLERSIKVMQVGMSALSIGLIGVIVIVILFNENSFKIGERTELVAKIHELEDIHVETKKLIKNATTSKLSKEDCDKKYKFYDIVAEYSKWCPAVYNPAKLIKSWQQCKRNCEKLECEQEPRLKNISGSQRQPVEQKCRQWVLDKVTEKCYLFTTLNEVVNLKPKQTTTTDIPAMISAIADCTIKELVKRFKNIKKNIDNDNTRVTVSTTKIKSFVNSPCPTSGVWYTEPSVVGQFDKYFTSSKFYDNQCRAKCEEWKCESWRRLSYGCWIGSMKAKTYSICHAACEADPTCMSWSWNKYPSSKSARRYRDRSYMCRLMTGSLKKKATDFYVTKTKSGTRGCTPTSYQLRNYIVYNTTESALKHFSKYHASFGGYGCHAQYCGVGSPSVSDHVVSSIHTIADCIDECYRKKTAQELTYAWETGTCYCKASATTLSYHANSTKKYLYYKFS